MSGFPYSFLHYLRRAFARVREGAPVTPVGPDEDPAEDSYLEDAASRLDAHLLCHSDCEGYYVPVDFNEVIVDLDERGLPGGILGSSQRLLAELVEVAPAIGIELQDGARSDRDERLLHGKKVPLFNELAVLQPSAYATFQVEVRSPRFDDDLDELPKLLFARKLAVENWTANVRQLCKACSEGLPGNHEHAGDAGGWRRFGIAAPDEAAVRDALDTWRAAHDGRSFAGLERVL